MDIHLHFFNFNPHLEIEILGCVGAAMSCHIKESKQIWGLSSTYLVQRRFLPSKIPGALLVLVFPSSKHPHFPHPPSKSKCCSATEVSSSAALHKLSLRIPKVSTFHYMKNRSEWLHCVKRVPSEKQVFPFFFPLFFDLLFGATWESRKSNRTYMTRRYPSS